MKNTVKNENVGTRLKSLRKGMGLNQKEFGELLGCAEITIRRYELGIYKPHMKVAKLISNYFNIPLDYIIKPSNSNEEEADINDAMYLFGAKFRNKALKVIETNATSTVENKNTALKNE